MLNETKILVENIKNFRHLITEGVGETDIVDAIQNHEWLYIYYAGDGKNKMGYRTVRPYVYGTHKTSGNPVVRVWQDNPRNSFHFSHRPTRPKSDPDMATSYRHDYWHNADVEADDPSVSKAGEVPGWRLLRLDRIDKVYPIGEKFEDEKGNVIIPPRYKGMDDSEINVRVAVTTRKKPSIDTEKPLPTGAKKTRIDWNNFSRANKANRQITVNDVIKLRNIASNVLKENRGKFIVAITNNNQFALIYAKDENKLPKEAVVGTLPHLIDKYINKNAPVDDKFFNASKEKIKQSIENSKQSEIKENELPTIPFERKTFFKQ